MPMPKLVIILSLLRVGLVRCSSSFTMGSWDKSCDLSPMSCPGPLLKAIQENRIFYDSKTFVDLILTSDEETMYKDFETAVKNDTRRDLISFLERHFIPAGSDVIPITPSDWTSRVEWFHTIRDPWLRKWANDINLLWQDLARQTDEAIMLKPHRHSLLSLPNTFVIPGGRFREQFYWDSYWTIKGLLLCNMVDTAKGMIYNLIDLVRRYGHVPNGNRDYFISRSQPPYLIQIVDAFVEHTNDFSIFQDNVDVLETEYLFWHNERSVIVNRNGIDHRLSVYRSNVGEPRPEGFMEDLHTVEGLNKDDAKRLFGELRAAAESGWDFSSRWLDDPSSGSSSAERLLSTAKTSRIIPVDLNAILCRNERILSHFYSVLGNAHKADVYRTYAEQRERAIESLLWSEEHGSWFDYDLDSKSQRVHYYASNIQVLFSGCYGNLEPQKQTDIERKVLRYLQKEQVLDLPYGLPTSKIKSGEQWDWMNTWAPLQHLFVEGFYNSNSLEVRDVAFEIAQKFVKAVYKSYSTDGLMYEKYDALTGRSGRGGEYTTVVGFGWTNAVILDFLRKYSDRLSGL